MTSVVAALPRTLTTARRRVAWPHPEWWALALAAAAWIWIAAEAATASAGSNSHAHSLSRSAASALVANSRDWLLMVAAMMFPLASGAMHAVAARSLWRRRHAAIAWWLAGYTAPWLAVGLVLSTVLAALGYSQAMPRWAVVIAFTVAAVWQVTPRRERALRQCHRVVPLAPDGWRANRDCIRYGWTIGVPCVAACGPLMVACSLVGHNPFGLAAMVAATIAGLAERYMTRPDPRWFAAAFTAQAMLVAVSVP